MSNAVYKLRQGSKHEKFFQDFSKVIILGGGFAAGKTAMMCVRALQFAEWYPGANILIGRATIGKLQSSTIKELKKWCPANWIKSFPKELPAACTLTNGSEFFVSYIAQTGKGSGGDTTSNVLSATFDAIFVDQFEDPELSYKDFLDLLGRLRGSTPCAASDPRLPRTGPRMLVIACNPTGNWIYSKLIRPLLEYQRTKRRTDDLLWDEENNKPVVSLYEFSTYDNSDNLPSDFIKTLENTYDGQMRDRYILGKWGAFEGLVYPTFNTNVHLRPRSDMLRYLADQQKQNRKLVFLEGYDYGIASPSCYLIGFVDVAGSVHIIDGFYRKEATIEEQIRSITNLRNVHIGKIDQFQRAYCDPQLGSRTAGSKTVVGRTVKDLFYDDGNGIQFTNGNANKINGITKIRSYLIIQDFRRNPYTREFGSPSMFFNEELVWLVDEISAYSWKKNMLTQEYEDEPIDKNDHAMDALKYLMTDRPQIGSINLPQPNYLPAWSIWQESDIATKSPKVHRYG